MAGLFLVKQHPLRFQRNFGDSAFLAVGPDVCLSTRFNKSTLAISFDFFWVLASGTICSRVHALQPRYSTLNRSIHRNGFVV
jgi:hypothetical protein